MAVPVKGTALKFRYMKKWYEIKLNGQEAIIKIEGVIGREVTSDNFSFALDNLKAQGVTKLHFHIHSGGGSMWDGNRIVNSIQHYPGEKIGYNMGLAASMAAVMLQACDKRYATPNAQYMIHNPSLSLDEVKEEEMDGLKQMMSNMRKSAAELLSKRSGLALDKIQEMMNKTTWLSSQQALELNLVDGILNTDGTIPGEKVTNFNMPKVSNTGGASFKIGTDIFTVENRLFLAEIKNKDSKIYSGAYASIVNNIGGQALNEFREKGGIIPKWEDFSSQEIAQIKNTNPDFAEVLWVDRLARVIANENRNEWTFEDWIDNDPEGFLELYKTDPERAQMLEQACRDKHQLKLTRQLIGS